MSTNWQYRFYKNIWVGLDWLFPPVCGGCGIPGTRWCQDCKSKVKRIDDSVCDACGLPQANTGLCERCQNNRPAYKQLRSWAVFENPVQGALHRLKYRRDVGLGEVLSGYVSEYVSELGWPVSMATPIPLGKRRLKERGYNQVAMIARPLSMQLGLDYQPDALTRARETRTQVGLSASERQENVRNAFLADKKKVAGQVILLMDDVSTTGATLSSAAEALYTSGAKDVFAVTVARALPHHSLNIV